MRSLLGFRPLFKVSKHSTLIQRVVSQAQVFPIIAEDVSNQFHKNVFLFHRLIGVFLKSA